MKKFIFIFIVALTSFVQGQERNWIVSFNPTNLYINQANIGIEFHEGKNSIMLNVGIPWNKNAIGKLGIEHDDFSFNKLGTECVRAAFRHYTNDHFGFYYEIAIKEATPRAYFVTQYPSIGTLNGWFYATTGGFQLGYQFVIWKRLTIDFYPLGLEAGVISGRINGLSKTATDAVQLANFVKGDIAVDLPKYMQKNFSIYTDGNVTQGILSNSFLPWLRSGVSIGFRF